MIPLGLVEAARRCHFKAFENASSPLFATRPAPPWDAEDLKGPDTETDWSLFAGQPDPSVSGSFPETSRSVTTTPCTYQHQPSDGGSVHAARRSDFWSFHAYIDVVFTDAVAAPVRDRSRSRNMRVHHEMARRCSGAAIDPFPCRRQRRHPDYNFTPTISITRSTPALRWSSASATRRPKRRRACLHIRLGQGASFKPAPSWRHFQLHEFCAWLLCVFRDKTYAVDVCTGPAGHRSFVAGSRARITFPRAEVSLWKAHL